MLEVKDLCVNYGAVQALTGISLREDALAAALAAHPTPVREYIHGASAEDIVRLILQ